MNTTRSMSLGLGIGWRSQLALVIDRHQSLGFVEITHEDHPLELPLLAPIAALQRRGVQCIPHGLTLNLGGADRPDPELLRSLAAQAQRVRAPLVSEHIAFVRADGREAGHLLPVERTRAMLNVLVENVKEAMDYLPVPLALENIATLFEWPGAEFEESDFLNELLQRTGALLLLDIENLYANARNHDFDPHRFLSRIPLDRIAYVHVAGGEERDGVYHDTHFHPVPRGVLDLLTDLASRAHLPGVMLERDDRLDDEVAISTDLGAIELAWKAGQINFAQNSSATQLQHG
jgi:uncharacterized protein (UPF0276 family)